MDCIWNQHDSQLKMAWDPYLVQLKSLQVEIGGLYGKNGALWAAHPHLQCSPNEIVVLADCIATRNDAIYGTGVKLAGKNWTVIRREDDVDVLILKGKDNDNNKMNLVIALSNMALVCGANESEEVGAGIIRMGVERIRDYLKSVNY